MTEEQEKIAVEKLQSDGYTVEINYVRAKQFNYKYNVYQKTSIGDKVIIVDENGQIIGAQG